MDTVAPPRPCRRCASLEKTPSGRCKPCKRARDDRWAATHPDAVRASQQRTRSRPEHLASERLRDAARRPAPIGANLPAALSADIRRRSEALGLPVHRLVDALLRSALTVCL